MIFFLQKYLVEIVFCLILVLCFFCGWYVEDMRINLQLYKKSNKATIRNYDIAQKEITNVMLQDSNMVKIDKMIGTLHENHKDDCLISADGLHILAQAVR